MDDASLQTSHTPQAVSARLDEGPGRSYLRDLVYGAIDGTVTTFAVVAGVRGAALATSVVVILGVANLVADGFSMAASNFLGIRAEDERRRRIRDEEQRHIAVVPSGEREEIRQIFAAKGFSGEDLERAVDVITADRARWLETMLVEEHGFAPQPASPLRSAVATFAAFLIVGFVPVLPFVLDLSAGVARPFAWSTASTAFAFLVVGYTRGRITDSPRLRAALETLLLGGAAAGLAFGIGAGLGAAT